MYHNEYGNSGINFLKYRGLTALFSAFIFALGIGLYVYKYQTRGHAFEYSVDFTGGTQIIMKFSKPTPSEAVLKVLENHGFAGAIAREFSADEVLVRVKQFENDADGLAVKMQALLQKELVDTDVEILQIDSVGAGIGESLRWKSTQAVLAGLLMMLLYIAFRFWSFAFAAGAVISLFHDAFVILVFFLLFDYEISVNVIGAILAVLGYSINDTIVIFSRIRENIASSKNTSIEYIVNKSTNETLRRTILTSVATTLVVISLVIFGGEVLRTLSLALLVGFIFGTYSSIFIASPVMLLLYKK